MREYRTRDEVARLLVATGRTRDLLMLRVICETGVRVSELLALSADSVGWHGRVLRARTLERRDHVRAIPLRPPLLGEPARYIAGAGIGGSSA